MKIFTKSSIMLYLLMTLMLSNIQGAEKNIHRAEEGHLMLTPLEEEKSATPSENYSEGIDQGIAKVEPLEIEKRPLGADVARGAQENNNAAWDTRIHTPRDQDSENKEDDTSSISEASVETISENGPEVYILIDCNNTEPANNSNGCCCIL